MTKTNQQLLLAAGPRIFKKSQVKLWGFECSDGWMSILLDLIINLEKRQCGIHIESQWVEVLQVKEKFGKLRFYASNTTKLDQYEIKLAEDKSGTTCEDCGNEGKLRSDGWMRTLCDTCSIEWKVKRTYEARN